MSAAKPRRLIFNSKLRAEKEYWVQRLSSGIGASSLRPDFDRSVIPAGPKSAIAITLPFSTAQTLAASQDDSLLSLYVTLMTALKVCLHKYTGSDLIVVGSPTYRADDASQPAPNALPIIDRIDSQQSFRACALGVRESLLEAYANQSYPFSRLIRDLGLEAVGKRFPLFGVALALTNIHDDLPELGNDITIVLCHSPQGISGKLEYDEQLFLTESVVRFARHLVNICDAAMASPDTLIYDLDPLTAEEQRQLVVDCNQTETYYPEDQSVPQLFAAQAARTPNAIALIYGEERLNYQELEGRANQLARYLQSLGVRPEARIAIYAERSPEMIVGVLAALKAGAAYLPLDTANPAQRVAFMLQDSEAQVILTQRHLLTTLPESDAQVVSLEDEERTIADYSAAPLPNTALPCNAAYVIYTSGSTGQPKGVLIEHRSFANMVHTLIREYGVRPESRVLQFASFGFDASVAEIFTTLCAGAALHLGSPNLARMAGDVTEVLRAEAITDVTLPPALLAVVAAEDLPELKTIISAGEACPAELVDRWGRGRRFINAYGPTETSVCASTLDCRGPYRGAVPIGRPISNTRLYVLDGRLRPVPVGVAAELYIGGVGVARGYLNRPGLTGERFVPDPFSRAPGARLYRTGDVARRGAGGVLEYVGRRDQQVKVRGYRVELGEVEAALLRQPGVREAAAAVESERVAAFVVSGPGAAGGEELRAAFGRELPGYMVPWRVLEVAALPLTANGKVDRKALSEAAGAWREAGEKEYEEPETEAERAVAGVWGEVLGVARVGRKEDFFALGGHSLLATQVISRLRALLGLELTAYDVFEHSTVIEFARHIETMSRATQDLESAVRVLPDGRDEGEL